MTVNDTSVPASPAERAGLTLVDAVTGAHALARLLDTMPAPTDTARLQQLTWARKVVAQLTTAVEGLVSEDVTEAIREQRHRLWSAGSNVAALCPAPPTPSAPPAPPAAGELRTLTQMHAHCLYGPGIRSMAQWSAAAQQVAVLSLANRRTWPVHLDWNALASVGAWLRPLAADEVLGILDAAASVLYLAQGR